jgi:hypothetical protein
MVTVRLSPTGKLDKKSIPWDPDSLLGLLDDFIQVDDKTKEVNIPYSSMEEFFQQAPERGTQPGWWYVSELEAQQSLAKICAWFLGSNDFKKPLSGENCCTGADNPDNPFRKFPGGLGRELRQDVEMIKRMTQRLKSFPGLEYCAINFPFHARRAAYLEYKDTKSLNWIRQTLRPLIDHWLTGNINDNEGNLRSWQEVHAFFCYEIPEDCSCHSFPVREKFMTDLKMHFLLEGEASATGCLWCGKKLSRKPSVNGTHSKSDDGILCDGCKEHNKYFANTKSGQSTKCGRLYRVYQNPHLLEKAKEEGREYCVDPF